MGTQPTSARKVARVAAKSGSKSAKSQRNWLFPAAIVAIVVLGLAVVVFARATTKTDSSTQPRANLNNGKPFDHWHVAFAIEACGKELPPVQDSTADDTLGIHTHGDGLIHIHPFTTAVAGKQAQLGVFFDRVGVKATTEGIQLQGGKVYKVGTTTCGGKPAVVRLAVWDKAIDADTTKPKIYTSDFRHVRFKQNYMAMTLSYDVPGATIKPPSTAPDLKTLGECDGANPPPQCSASSSASSPTGAVTVPSTVPETVTTPTTAATPTTAKGKNSK